MTKFNKINLKNGAEKSIKQAVERNQIKIKEPPTWEERMKMLIDNEFGSQEPGIFQPQLQVEWPDVTAEQTTLLFKPVLSTEKKNKPIDVNEIHEDLANQNKEITMLRNKVDELEEIIKQQQIIIDTKEQKTQKSISKLEEKFKKFDKYASALKWARNYIRKTCKSVN